MNVYEHKSGDSPTVAFKHKKLTLRKLVPIAENGQKC